MLRIIHTYFYILLLHSCDIRKNICADLYLFEEKQHLGTSSNVSALYLSFLQPSLTPATKQHHCSIWDHQGTSAPPYPPLGVLIMETPISDTAATTRENPQSESGTSYNGNPYIRHCVQWKSLYALKGFAKKSTSQNTPDRRRRPG